MPPPIPQQQGSRAALITALVCFVILSATFAILYSYEVSLRNTDLQNFSEKSANYAKIASDADMSGAVAKRLQALQSDPKLPYSQAGSLLQVSNLERENYATQLTGNKDAGAADSETAILQAMQHAKSVVDEAATEAAKKLGDNPDLASMVSSFKADATAFSTQMTGASNVVQKISNSGAAFADAVNQAITLNDKLKAQASNSAAKLDELQKTIAANQATIDLLNKDKATAAALAAKAQQDQETRYGDLTRNTEQEINSAKTAAHALEIRIQGLNDQIAALTKDNAVYIKRIGQFHLDTKKPMEQIRSGIITKMVQDDQCVINRGSEDQISPGMTFEIYDSAKPIPYQSTGMSETDLPIGKGSIEVRNVLDAHSSLCTITHREAGSLIQAGDSILNLVYNPNVKYKFVVYGDFDFTNRDKANAEDANIIKSLIQRFGGSVATGVDDVNVNTDFVVLGVEPQEPNIPLAAKDTSESLRALQRYNEKKAAYDKVLKAATDLGIPVLNQNRFLYLVGYYNQRLQ